MRTSADRRRARIGAGPARVSVADRIFTHGESGGGVKFLEIRPRLQVRWREEHTRDRRIRRVGNLRERLDLGAEFRLVNGNAGSWHDVGVRKGGSRKPSKQRAKRSE